MVWFVFHAIYLAAVLGMAGFGLHSGWLLWRGARRRRAAGADAADEAPPAGADAPRVTVQLPIFNERFVAERIIRAAAALDWPRERLQIQVLDDSTDDTVVLTAALVDELAAGGLDIEHRARAHRTGYKAGALAAALPAATGEFIAIFDADFAPAPDWLRRTLGGGRAFADPRTGFVQTRWTYLNRERSLLTRAQAMMHDVHFLVEQPVRRAEGLWFNFNGSGGLWRRVCIEDAGGWQADTLTEDLDLSYRAALRGWRGEYLAGVEAPNELPERLLAFKRQQARWARGSIQTARKLLGPVWRGEGGGARKFFAAVHLCGYGMHPLLCTFMILGPVIAAGSARGLAVPFWTQLLAPSCLGFLLGFPIVQRWRGRDWRRIGPELALTLVVGVGVSVSNTLAVGRGLFLRASGEFVRTPKSGEGRPAARYRLKIDGAVFWELAMAVWLGAWALALWRGGARWWCLSTAVYAICYLHFVLRQALELWADRKAVPGAEASAPLGVPNAG